MADKPFYTRAALLGVALYLVVPVLFLIAVLISNSSDIFFILFFAVPALIAGAAVYFIRPWGLIVGVLGGLFGLLVLTEGVDLFLTTPQAFFDFSTAIFGITGLLILLISSVLGLIAHFRHREPRTTANPTESLILRGIVGVLVVLAVISLVLTLINAGGVSDEEAEGTTLLTAKETEWNVEMINTTTGQTLRLLVNNEDPILHTFTVHDLDIDERLGPWTETIIDIPTNRATTFGFICRVVGHEEDMSGVIVIR